MEAISNNNHTANYYMFIVIFFKFYSVPVSLLYL
jgi:hypothetical protein